MFLPTFRYTAGSKNKPIFFNLAHEINDNPNDNNIIIIYGTKSIIFLLEYLIFIVVFRLSKVVFITFILLVPVFLSYSNEKGISVILAPVK